MLNFILLRVWGQTNLESIPCNLQSSFGILALLKIGMMMKQKQWSLLALIICISKLVNDVNKTGCSSVMIVALGISMTGMFFPVKLHGIYFDFL